MTAGMSGRAAAIFEARRVELNGRFAQAGRGLAPGVMLGYLRNTVAPLLDGWPHEHAEALAVALFDLGLAGAPLGLVAEHSPTPFERGLGGALAELGALLGPAPDAVVRAIGNGYLRVARARGDEVASDWLRELARHGAPCTSREGLLDLGLVLAWRVGMAEARDAALERTAHLDEPVRRELFGHGDLDVDPERRFVSPVRGPSGEPVLGALRLVTSAGGFVGFGGPFCRPPEARVVEGRLVCTDGLVTCELFADLYGASLLPAAWAHAAAATSTDTGGATFRPDGRITVGHRACVDDRLRGASTAARALGMVAVTLADSHRIFVLGRTADPGRTGPA